MSASKSNGLASSSSSSSSTSASSSMNPSTSHSVKRSRLNPVPSLPSPAPRSSAGSALKSGSTPRVDPSRSRRRSKHQPSPPPGPSDPSYPVPDETRQPDFDKGVTYWEGVQSSVDGVLGGFGNGPVPHIEGLGSRLMLLGMCPQLHTFGETPLTPFPASSVSHTHSLSHERISDDIGRGSPQHGYRHRTTALDVGAGIGRVTRNTLLPLFDDVVLVEPVGKFIQEGLAQAKKGEWVGLDAAVSDSSSNNDHSRAAAATQDAKLQTKKAESRSGKRVRFIQKGLQGLDPADPGKEAVELGIIGSVQGLGPDEGWEKDERGGQVYDVIWCQWCLGHMSTPQLILFLRTARKCLRPDSPFTWPPSALSARRTLSSSEPSTGADSTPATQHTSTLGEYETALKAGRVSQSFIFVKENVCEDHPDGSGREFLDEEDSSLTRSNAKWLEIFEKAGLEVVKEETQVGMPEELFPVKTWALR